MTDRLGIPTVRPKDTKSRQLVEMANRHGQVTIEFSRSQCRRFLGVAGDTTSLLDSITMLDAPQHGLLKGVMLVVFTSTFCEYVYEIIDFLYKGKGRITGVLEAEGNRYALRIRLNEPKKAKLELVKNSNP
jgi:hypothetical protein